MKRIAMMLVMALCLCGCFSAGTVTEAYRQTPAHAKSVGEGQSTFMAHIKGKTYIVAKGPDGKWHVVGEQKEGAE